MDVMLDLETMGNGSDAAIVAIGAVEFDTNNLGRTFYQEIDLEDSVKMGGVMDASTVVWWMQQSDEARAAVYRKGGTPLLQALTNFADWLTECGAGVTVWGNGATFDNVILHSAYRSVSVASPWKYYNDRCYRTLKALLPEVKMVRAGTHHNALDDAISQANHAMALMGWLHA